MDFNDGSEENATVQNPVHTFIDSGTYTVSLTATNDGGSNTTTQENYITVTDSPISPIPITGTATISSPGSYALLADIVNAPFTDPWNGITITSSDVWLDGMGHTIDGVDPNVVYTNGIIAASSGELLNNITLRNLTLKGRSHGIFFRNVSNSRISDCIIVQNGQDGIRLEGSNHITIIDNEISGSTLRGISLTNSDENSIEDTTFSENSIGVYLKNAARNEIFDCTIEGNTNSGFYLNYSTQNSIFNNYLNNPVNVNIIVPPDLPNLWNPQKTAGTNIIGGSYLGGNYWAQPDGQGFSQINPDTDGDGISEAEFILTAENSDHLPLTNNLSAPSEPVASFDALQPRELTRLKSFSPIHQQEKEFPPVNGTTNSTPTARGFR